MAPFMVTDPWVVFAIGFGFGFVLESAGFGDCRNLAAQFYFRDMRVLKVMFTGILVTLVGLHLGGALGVVDLAHIYVNPTHLWPAILGGLLLGLGFIVGGYCPGTSVVSAATGKLDGLAFLLGVTAGIFAFGENVEGFRVFWETSGAMGRLTLADVLGVDAGVLVVGVTAMALAAFAGAEWAEGLFARADAAEAGLPPPTTKPVPGWAKAAAAALAGLAVWTAALGQPGLAERMDLARGETEAVVRSRALHVEPAELLDLKHNVGIAVEILDVRPEGDFNLFHITDARRVTPAMLAGSWITGFADASVKVLVSNDEEAAEHALAVLLARGVPNVYVLAGGIHGWLHTFEPGLAIPAATPETRDRLRVRFDAALGGRHPASNPDRHHAGDHPYEKKVKVAAPSSAPGGGCG